MAESEDREAYLARCIDSALHDDEAAFERLCDARPELAAEARRRVASLRAAGLLSLAAADRLPASLGRYRVLSRIGSGGMGTVYLAEQPELGRQVALKVVRSEQLYFPGARERFQREIEAIARLQVPGVVPILDVGAADGVPYYAMEHLPGIDLGQLLARTRELGDSSFAAVLAAEPAAAAPRTPDSNLFEGGAVHVAARIAMRLARTVARIHEHGIVHRDLKPSNVMLDRDGRVTIVDFGLAHLADADELTRSGALLGSLPYMAPEQVRGERAAIGPATDIYAIGLVLHELVYREPAFRGDDQVELAQRIAAGRRPRRNGPRDLETIIACATDPDPARRYASADALADDLLRYLEFRPIQQRPSGFGLRLMRWSQRHRTLAVGAAAAIVLAIVLPTAIAIERSHALAQVSDERDRYERAVTGVVDILGRAQPLLDDVAELDGGETGEAVRELFRRMTDFYGELRRFDAARPAIRDALVQAQYHEALLLTDLGEFEQADALADALLGIVGEDDQHRRLRYELRVARGQVLENRGEYPAAEAELRAAIAEIDRLPQASVDDRMRAGRARVTIAILLSRRFSEGLVAAAQDAVTAFEEIVAQEPGNVDAQSYLAHARRLSAQVLSRSGNEERALELLQRTRADLQDRLVAHRRDRKLRIELAKTEQVIAEEHRLAGRHEAALPHLRAAVAARRDFLQIWPNRPTVAGHLADSLSDLGSSLNLVERPEEARGALEEAKALLEEQLARDAELEVFERQLAVVCMELGKAMAATSGLGPESHAMSEHAVELIDGVIARQENVLPDYYAERAMARAGCGQSHFNLGRARPALELLLGARDDLQRYLAEASEDGSMKRQLGQICLVTSLVAAKVEEIDTVEELLRQADELIGFDASDVTFLAPLLGDERAAAILQRLGK